MFNHSIHLPLTPAAAASRSPDTIQPQHSIGLGSTDSGSTGLHHLGQTLAQITRYLWQTEPIHVELRRDRQGQSFYHAINTHNGEQFSTPSSTEMRTWIESRYNR